MLVYGACNELSVYNNIHSNVQNLKTNLNIFYSTSCKIIGMSRPEIACHIKTIQDENIQQIFETISQMIEKRVSRWNPWGLKLPVVKREQGDKVDQFDQNPGSFAGFFFY